MRKIILLLSILLPLCCLSQTKQETIDWIDSKLKTFTESKKLPYSPYTVYESRRFETEGATVRYITEKYYNDKTTIYTITFNLNDILVSEGGDEGLLFYCIDNDTTRKNIADVMLNDNCFEKTDNISDSKEYMGGFDLGYKIDTQMVARLKNAFTHLWSLNNENPNKEKF